MGISEADRPLAEAGRQQLKVLLQIRQETSGERASAHHRSILAAALFIQWAQYHFQRKVEAAAVNTKVYHDGVRVLTLAFDF